MIQTLVAPKPARIVPAQPTTLYAALAVALIVTLRAMSRRWRDADEQDVEVPYGPDAGPPADLAAGASG